MNKYAPISIVCIFTWIGFVCAISFMEAWLKFKAPGVSISIGLGIGRLVFNALNKIEWVFMLSILASLFAVNGWKGPLNLLVLIPLVILLLQTFLMLPRLDARAEVYISGGTPESSSMHFYYAVLELAKVITLLILGIQLLYSMNTGK